MSELTHKLYMAGKIEKNCWRNEMVNLRRQTAGNYEGDWPTLEQVVFDKHDYVGPFFAGCDHGLFHGRSTHGVMYDGRRDGPCCDLQPLASAETLRRCKAAIRRSTTVYAWIDSLDAFGTYAEIGYAHAIGKTIWIAGPEMFPDLWFVYEMAGIKLFGCDNPVEGLKAAIERPPPGRLEKISEVVTVLSIEEGETEITTRTGGKLKKPVVHYRFSGEDGEYEWTSYSDHHLEHLRPGDSVGLAGSIKARSDSGFVLTRCKLSRSEVDEMAAFDREA